MVSISNWCKTYPFGLVEVCQLGASALYHKTCKASVLENCTVFVLRTVMRSDVFDPTPQLGADTPKADVQGTLKFCHVTMISRYAANLFFAITNLG